MSTLTKTAALVSIALSAALCTQLASPRLALAGAGMSADSSAAGADDDYDRLDGKGASGEKVDVVEWEGNLEIHVMPAGTLKGLALKLDQRDKNKPVMVIGYRFTNDPKKQLIRRAILGINLQEGFKAYRDTTADGYDKIVISNNGLSGDLVAFKLEPEPTQLYPDGHPALAQGKGSMAPEEKRAPASQGHQDDRPRVDDDSGTIQPFFLHEGPHGRQQ